MSNLLVILPPRHRKPKNVNIKVVKCHFDDLINKFRTVIKNVDGMFTGISSRLERFNETRLVSPILISKGTPGTGSPLNFMSIKWLFDSS